MAYLTPLPVAEIITLNEGWLKIGDLKVMWEKMLHLI
jgi:hypothetical protein